MPRIAYTERNFSSSSLSIIDNANTIIDEYTSQGYQLTLRQLYYQFVSRNLIQNKQSEYKRLGSILSDARIAGLVDWDALQDMTRNLITRSCWENAEHLLRDAAAAYHTDPWRTQTSCVEVWIEKDALLGIVEPVCNKYSVPCMSCRGYISQSEMWLATQRAIAAIADGKQEYTVFHFADHDPSGIDMTEDIQRRFDLFTGYDCHISVHRKALHSYQVAANKLPPNPAKITDSRYAPYRDAYGPDSWELDALDPRTLEALVQDEILKCVDPKAWAAWERSCKREKRELTKLYETWDTVRKTL